MYSWLKRCASWLASAITLRALSVNRSNIFYLELAVFKVCQTP
jgi:hypothetical protein